MIATSPNIPARFKQTEAGVIPDDWRVENLDECVRNDAPICYGILMPGQFHDGGVPVIKVKDIMRGRVDESTILLTDPTIDNAYKRSRLRTGDLLITIRGTTGRVAIVPKSLDGANITQDTARVRLNGNHSSKFLYFALQSRAAQDQIALHTIGQAVKGINIRDVKEVVVPIPPTLAEQEAIAEALGDVDALIESLEQLVAKKRRLKQAAMQQLLAGKKRLPGFEGEWRTRVLDSFAEVIMGHSPPGNTYNDSGDGVPLINGPTEFTKRIPIKKQWTTEPTRFCHAGDVLVCVRGSSTGRINISNDRYCIGRGVCAIRERANSVTAFLEFAVADIVDRILVLSAGSTFPSIDGASLRSIKVTLPPKPEQAAIGEVLSDMDTEIEAIERKLFKAREIKQGMMQELLTGRTRLV